MSSLSSVSSSSTSSSRGLASSDVSTLNMPTVNPPLQPEKQWIVCSNWQHQGQKPQSLPRCYEHGSFRPTATLDAIYRRNFRALGTSTVDLAREACVITTPHPVRMHLEYVGERPCWFSAQVAKEAGVQSTPLAMNPCYPQEGKAERRIGMFFWSVGDLDREWTIRLKEVFDNHHIIKICVQFLSLERVYLPLRRPVHVKEGSPPQIAYSQKDSVTEPRFVPVQPLGDSCFGKPSPPLPVLIEHHVMVLQLANEDAFVWKFDLPPTSQLAYRVYVISSDLSRADEEPSVSVVEIDKGEDIATQPRLPALCSPDAALSNDFLASDTIIVVPYIKRAQCTAVEVSLQHGVLQPPRRQIGNRQVILSGHPSHFWCALTILRCSPAATQEAIFNRFMAEKTGVDRAWEDLDIYHC